MRDSQEVWTVDMDAKALVRAVSAGARAEAARLAAHLRTLDEADWQAQSACAEWSVRDVAAHLLMGQRMFGRYADRALRGEQGGDLAAERKELIAQARALPTAELPDAFEREVNAYFDRVEGLAPEELGKPTRLVFGEFPLYVTATMRLSEIALHSWDIRVAKDPAARIDPPIAAGLARNAAGAIGMLTRKGAPEHPDAVYHFAVAGAGDFTLTVKDHRASMAPGAAGDVTADLELDADQFVRLLWGRLDLRREIAAGRVRAAGDASRVQDLFRGVG